jgi:hypothetical protein
MANFLRVEDSLSGRVGAAGIFNMDGIDCRAG